MAARPVRTVNPTSKLIDPNNTETAVLSSHRQAVVSAQAAAAQQHTVTPNVPLPEIVSPPPSNSAPLQVPRNNAALPPSTSPTSSPQPNTLNKRAPSVEISSDDEDEVPVEKPRHGYRQT